MIRWNDFVMDDVCGPVLAFAGAEEGTMKVSRGKRLGSPSVMEDAGKIALGKQIQETGQELRPARMVGHSASDSFKTRMSETRTGMEAGRGDQAVFSRRRGEA